MFALRKPRQDRNGAPRGRLPRRPILATALAVSLIAATLQIAAGGIAAANPHGVGLVDPATGQWHLYDASGLPLTSFYYGNPGDYPMLGDWDGDGDETPGLYRQSDGYVYLRNSNTQGVADIKFYFGNPGDVPVAGDFNGDGFDTVSIYRPSNQTFYIINKLGSNDGGLGAAEFSYVFGNPGDKPFVGDFDGDGIETVGLHRESTGLVYFRNNHTQGNADNQFIFGDPGDRLVAGDWTGDGVFTPALFRPSNTTMYFRYSNTQGNADAQFTKGQSSWIPVAGRTGRTSVASWTKHEIEDDAGLLSVAANADTVVAVGWIEVCGENFCEPSLQAWYSTDGTNWTRADMAGLRGFKGQMRSVTHGPGGFYATGCRNVAGQPNAEIWRSTNGRTWEWVTDTAFDHQERSCFNSIIHMPGTGFIAGGWKENRWEGAEVEAWRSPDGSNWKRDAMKDYGFEVAGAYVESFAAHQGDLVAVGHWEYVDVAGSVFERTTTAGGPWLMGSETWQTMLEPLFLYDVAHIGTRFVAVGKGLRPLGSWATWQARAATSTSGYTWYRSPEVEVASGVSSEMSGVISTPSGVVAVGTKFGEPNEPRVWLSADGNVWVQQELGGTGRINDVAAFGADLISVGEDPSGAAVWITSG